MIVLADQISRHTASVAKAEAGLNLSQWRVLAAVVDKPGRTAAEVAMMTPMDKTIVSRAVNTLIEMGVIKKSALEDDKRRFSLNVTPQGADIYVKIVKHLNKTIDETLSRNSEQQSFIAELKKFSSKMNQVL